MVALLRMDSGAGTAEEEPASRSLRMRECEPPLREEQLRRLFRSLEEVAREDADD